MADPGLRRRSVLEVWTVERLGGSWPVEGGVCSVPGCGISFDDLGYLIDITVVTSPGEEGYAEVTQWFCQTHYEYMRNQLLSLGFGSHNHHGTNLLDAEDECGGWTCPHPVEYGPELVVPFEPVT